MRKWSRGLSGWPSTERRGDAYGSQPYVPIDLHGHTAINLSRQGAVAVVYVLGRAASPIDMPRNEFERALVQDRPLAPDVRGVQPDHAVYFDFARPSAA